MNGLLLALSAALAGGLALLAFLLALTGKRHAKERGLVPRYRARASLLVGNGYIPKPYGRVAVYDRFLVIATPFYRFAFPYEEVGELSVLPSSSRKGAALVHFNPRLPQMIRIYAPHPEEIVSSVTNALKRFASITEEKRLRRKR